MEELYDNLYGSNFTIISNEFLEKYLSDTKSEYIKVFLFYLWKGLKEGYTIEEVSNEIDLDENIIEKALKYWIRKKIMKKECLISNKSEKETTIKEKTENLVDFQTKKKELINKKRKPYEEIERDLLFVAEKLLGQTMSESQERLIAKCYNEYGFDEGLIHYLLEYCSNNSKSTNYMNKIAESWYEEGIKTEEVAKKYVEKIMTSKLAKGKKESKIKSNVINRKEYDQKLINSILNSKYKV